MKTLLPALLFGLSLSTASSTPAVAYPVDCAILLCLAGGWPASVECAHARAVFIARITPRPIEPPLQIWNCPMRASYRQEQRPMEMVNDIAVLRDAPPLSSVPEMPLALQQVQDRADADISGREFDFVRSIRVFEITYNQRQTEKGDCRHTSLIYEGSYGPQGEYRRRQSGLNAVPDASILTIPKTCRSYSFRSVFVEWRDYSGVYGYEEVQY